MYLKTVILSNLHTPTGRRTTTLHSVLKEKYKVKFMKKNKKVLTNRLRDNWFFPFCASAFFYLATPVSYIYDIGVIIAFFIAILIAAYFPPVIDEIKTKYIAVRIFWILTAAGICEIWYPARKLQCIADGLDNWIHIPGFAFLGIIALAFFFSYICTAFFWKRLYGLLRDSNVFCGVRKSEIIVYMSLLLVSLTFSAVVFLRSNAFYGSPIDFNVIYTSDSSALVKNNTYLNLTYGENDLRQPLFAVFSAPFLGAPYFLSRLLPVSWPTTASIQAFFLNGVQIALLLLANFMLSQTLKLPPVKRVCFMLLSCCSYSYLLSVIMMEQYIVAYFWLILFIYLYCENEGHFGRIVLWGAGGTLLTSMILLPLSSEHSPVSEFKAWFTDMMKNGMSFILFMLAFCRFDIFYNLFANIRKLLGYTGQNIAFYSKIQQYVSFVRNCFVAPNAAVILTPQNFFAWRQAPVTGLGFTGITILLLVLVSAIINRKEKICVLAFSWVIFSVIMLGLVGWGIRENGLMLYSLYFSWAFLVLLFFLANKIGEQMRFKCFLPVASIVGCVVLVILNIPAVSEMIRFAVSYYPVLP